MPGAPHHPKRTTTVKNNPPGSKANLLFDQKTEMLLSRIQVLEKENRALTRRLINKEQLNLEKDKALSTASHDCRSNLTSIQLSASLVERYYDRLDGEKLFGHLDKIKLAVIELTDKLDALIAL